MLLRLPTDSSYIGKVFKAARCFLGGSEMGEDLRSLQQQAQGDQTMEAAFRRGVGAVCEGVLDGSIPDTAQRVGALWRRAAAASGSAEDAKNVAGLGMRVARFLAKQDPAAGVALFQDVLALKSPSTPPATSPFPAGTGGLVRDVVRRRDPALAPLVGCLLPLLKDRPAAAARLAHLAAGALPDLARTNPDSVAPVLDLLVPPLKARYTLRDQQALADMLHIGLAVAPQVAATSGYRAAGRLVTLAAETLPRDGSLQDVAGTIGVGLAPVLAGQNAAEAHTLLDALLRASPAEIMTTLLVATKVAILTESVRQGVSRTTISGYIHTAAGYVRTPEAACALLEGAFKVLPEPRGVIDDAARAFVRELEGVAGKNTVARARFVQVGSAAIGRGGEPLLAALMRVCDEAPETVPLFVEGVARALPGANDRLAEQILTDIGTRARAGNPLVQGLCVKGLCDALPGFTPQQTGIARRALSLAVELACADDAIASGFFTQGLKRLPHMCTPVAELFVQGFEKVCHAYPACASAVFPQALATVEQVAASETGIHALPVFCAALARLSRADVQNNRAFFDTGLRAVNTVLQKSPLNGTARPVIGVLSALAGKAGNPVERDQLVTTALNVVAKAGAGNACAVTRLFAQLLPRMPGRSAGASEVFEAGYRAMQIAVQWDVSAAGAFVQAAIRAQGAQASVVAMQARPVTTFAVSPAVVAQIVPLPQKKGPPRSERMPVKTSGACQRLFR